MTVNYGFNLLSEYMNSYKPEFIFHYYRYYAKPFTFCKAGLSEVWMYTTSVEGPILNLPESMHILSKKGLL